ncbi:MAG: M23 family peptidase, partial [Pseudomonadota bacterium]
NGLIGEPPTLEAVRDGLPAIAFDPADDVLVLWARAFGLRAGDVLRLRLLAPDGREMAANDRVLDRARAEEFSFIGVRRPGGDWSKGRYQAEIAFIRDGRPVETRTQTLLIE